MDRRRFLNRVGAVGLSLPAIASSAWTGPQSAADSHHRSGSRSRSKSHKIVGIGGAGCNMLVGLASSVNSESSDLTVGYICVDLGSETLPRVDASTGAMLDYSPIRFLSLAEFGAGGSVNAARAAALRKRDELKDLVAGANLVFLVAGLGGGTGSGVTPIMAKLAREAGALTVATVITPFAFEGQRRRTAGTALGYLKRDADLVVEFSNEELAATQDDSMTMDWLFTMIDLDIQGGIREIWDQVNLLDR